MISRKKRQGPHHIVNGLQSIFRAGIACSGACIGFRRRFSGLGFEGLGYMWDM